MAINFDNVSYKYNNKTILSNINLEMKEKQINVITGKSGSGKTTFLELISKLIIPTEGAVKLNTDKVSIVLQNIDDQFFFDTPEKEIAFSTKHLNRKVYNINKHVLDSLIIVGLDETFLNRNINILSSGEKKKIAIALALSSNPKVLILDEPTINLDNDSIESLIKLLKLLKNKYNKTIIISSKDTDFIYKIADKVIILEKGNVVVSGNKYDIFKEDVEKYGLKKPKIVEFVELARNKKNKKLLYRDEINDLMKDIYRCVR